MKKKIKSRGLGDTVEKITHFLKIDFLAKKIAFLLNKEDCGCTRRRDKLNQLVPYNKK